MEAASWASWLSLPGTPYPHLFRDLLYSVRALHACDGNTEGPDAGRVRLGPSQAQTSGEAASWGAWGRIFWELVLDASSWYARFAHHTRVALWGKPPDPSSWVVQSVAPIRRWIRYSLLMIKAWLKSAFKSSLNFYLFCAKDSFLIS